MFRDAGNFLVASRRLGQFKDGLAVGDGGFHQFCKVAVVGRGINAESDGLFLHGQGFAVSGKAAREVPDGNGGDLVVRHVRNAGFLRVIYAHGRQFLEGAQQDVHHLRVRIQREGISDFPGSPGIGRGAFQGNALSLVVDFNGGGHCRMDQQGAMVTKLADAGLEEWQDVAGAHQNAGVAAVKVRLHVGSVVRRLVFRIVHQPGGCGPPGCSAPRWRNACRRHSFLSE